MKAIKVLVLRFIHVPSTAVANLYLLIFKSAIATVGFENLPSEFAFNVGGTDKWRSVHWLHHIQSFHLIYLPVYLL